MQAQPRYPKDNGVAAELGDEHGQFFLVTIDLETVVGNVGDFAGFNGPSVHHFQSVRNFQRQV